MTLFETGRLTLAASNILLLSLLSCSHPSPPRTIAVIPETSAAELWDAEHAGAQRAGNETGFHIYWNAPTRADDVERQIELIEKVVEDEDFGLVLAPDQYLALMAPVRDALAKHIPIVVVRSPLPILPGEGISYLLNDEDEMGRIAAMRVGQLLNGEGSVAVLGVNTSAVGTVLRLRAFEAVLARAFPRISIVGRWTGTVNSAETEQVAEEILGDHPRLDAILGLNVAATQGALRALKRLGRSQQVKLVGCDQELDLMGNLRRGEIDSLVIENSYEMGYRAVKLIAARGRHENVPSEAMVKPVLVTKDNIDMPELQRMLSVDWRFNP